MAGGEGFCGGEGGDLLEFLWGDGGGLDGEAGLVEGACVGVEDEVGEFLGFFGSGGEVFEEGGGGFAGGELCGGGGV